MGVSFYMLQCYKGIYLWNEETAELNLGKSNRATESLEDPFLHCTLITYFIVKLFENVYHLVPFNKVGSKCLKSLKTTNENWGLGVYIL